MTLPFFPLRTVQNSSREKDIGSGISVIPVEKTNNEGDIEHALKKICSLNNFKIINT